MLTTLNMDWKAGTRSWEQASYSVEKSFKQEKMKPTPKLPFSQNKTDSTLCLRLHRDYLSGLAAKVALLLLLFRKKIEMGMGPWTHTWAGSSLKLALLLIHAGTEVPLIPEAGLRVDTTSVVLLQGNQAQTYPCGTSPDLLAEAGKTYTISCGFWQYPEQGLALGSKVKSSHSQKYHLSPKNTYSWGKK